jgi:hypothetical protein
MLSWIRFAVVALSLLSASAGVAQDAREFPLHEPHSLERLPDAREYLEEMKVFFAEHKSGAKTRTGDSFVGVGRAGENAYGTWGFLFVEESGQLVHKGYTLEPRSSVGKGPIPVGTYSYRKWDSPSLHKTLRLYNVTGFTDILVHVGNTQADTKGCILVGRGVDSTSVPTRLTDSRVLVDYLYDRLCRKPRAGIGLLAGV